MFLTQQLSSFFSIIPPKRSKKFKECINLARNIKLSGIKMSSYTFCDQNSHKCVVTEQSKRYAKCAYYRQKYNVKGIPARDQASLKREEERLKTKEEKAAA